MLLRPLTHADVTDRRGYQNSSRAFQGAQHDLNRKFGAVLALPDQFDSGADLLRQRVRRGPKTVREQPFGKTIWNDVGDLLPKELVAAISELLLRLQIQQDDLSTLVYHHHRIGSRLEQSALSGFHLRPMLLRTFADADVH